MIENDSPISYDEVADLSRFNELLESITEKLFVSPMVFAQAVRAACDLYGIVLPPLEVEHIGWTSPMDGESVLTGETETDHPTGEELPDNEEIIFNIEDSDGNLQDIYLYLIMERTEQGLYDCYAQLVNDEDLEDLLTLNRPEKTLDLNTSYLDQVRHANGNDGTTGDREIDDGPPLE